MKVIKAFLFTVLVFLAVIPAAAETKTRDYWPTEDWQTSSPEKLGFDTAKLQSIDAFVKQSLPRTASILIIRNGYIAYETYYAGDKNTPRGLYEETASMISILIGMLVNSHQIGEVEDSMLSYLPELRSENLAPNVEKITIRNLLTMSSGLPLPHDPVTGTISIDEIKGMLSRPLESIPGEAFVYNATNSNLLSMIITKITKKTAAEFAASQLFQPLGIKKYYWLKSSGYSKSVSGLSLNCRDMAKIGYLYLNHGKWDTKEIVPESWVSESTTSQVRIDAASEYWRNYGFLWWVSSFKDYGAFFAYGFAGQLIVVMPDPDLVVVITAGDEHAEPYNYFAIITDCIIPALK
jgi:CubicO group peptidase (beta-lactamase class C family)